MADLIDRQAAIDVLNKLARENFTLINAFSFYLGALHDAADEIKNLPSAQPEIIRCKDCRYHIPQDGRCRLWCQFVDQSEWCSRAERKGGEADG